MSAKESEKISLGHQLRDTRLQQKLKIPDIATHLCIKPEYLKAIEADEYSVLPDGVYRRAFVRSYALYLGIDDKILAAVPLPEAKKPRLSRRVHGLDMSGGDTAASVPSRLSLLLSLGLLLVVIAVWYGFFSRDESAAIAIPTAPQAVQDVADNLSDMVHSLALLGRDVMQAPEDTLRPERLTDDVPSTVLPMAATLPLPAAISLRATAETFIEVRDATGALVFEKIMQAGEVYPLPEQEGLSLLTGNAGGLEFVVEGQNLGAFGAPDTVRRLENVSVDAVRAAYAATVPDEPALTAEP